MDTHKTATAFLIDSEFIDSESCSEWKRILQFDQDGAGLEPSHQNGSLENFLSFLSTAMGGSSLIPLEVRKPRMQLTSARLCAMWKMGAPCFHTALSSWGHDAKSDARKKEMEESLSFIPLDPMHGCRTCTHTCKTASGDLNLRVAFSLQIFYGAIVQALSTHLGTSGKHFQASSGFLQLQGYSIRLVGYVLVPHEWIIRRWTTTVNPTGVSSTGNTWPMSYPMTATTN
ncbi:hypothetical protein BC826DRAFT_1174743 [Russula brevipes]|nr:hypothetical protein BC826DRAFT_1174743 [Russula brevipes]